MGLEIEENRFNAPSAAISIYAAIYARLLNRKVHLNLTLYAYLEPLLNLYEKTGQQPDNLCGPYWLSLLLQAYGERSISAVEGAIAAATILPDKGHPTDWLPPGASSRRGPGYGRIPTVPELAACGTSIAGLIHATEDLSQGRFCLIPLQTEDWIAGLSALQDLCHGHPDWQIVPLLNILPATCGALN